MFTFQQAGRVRAFTMVELMVTIALVAILAALVTVNLTEQRKSGRDANRQAALTEYAASFEQYYAQNRTYMLEPAGCHIGNTSATYPGAHESFLLPVGPEDSCVGYLGGSWGSLNRRNGDQIADYKNTTIAEALRAAGFLQRVSTDPRLAGESPTRPASSYKDANGVVTDFDDYILTLCTNEGKPAQNRKEATEFGLFVQLERSQPAETVHQASSKESCGGPETGYGWDTIQ